MIRTFVGLGANLGDPASQLRSAAAALAELPKTCIVACSSLWRTPAWGPVPQPDYLNAVIALDTDLAPGVLLSELLRIEREHGRVRNEERYGPRTLDLDLLLYGDACIDEPGLQVPHPQLARRAFVMLPLVEIAPGLLLPCDLGRAGELRDRVDASGCVVTGRLL